MANCDTSSTVMMNMPGVEAALRRAVDECPHLGLGVHLVFTAWRPLLPPEQVPTLVNAEGQFHDQRTLWQRPDRIDRAELRAELRAQIERFRAVTGRDPDHLDCHHFTHVQPALFSIYVELAAEYGLPVRLPFPPPEELEATASTVSLFEGLSLPQVQDIVAQDVALARAAGVRHPDRFVGSFYGEQALRLSKLLALLEGLPEGVSELMCHPGRPDPALAASTYTWQREKEVKLLCHPRVRERLAELGIELVTFTDVRSL